jgi:RNA polymerase sigma-70 factor (ECF subfamily)
MSQDRSADALRRGDAAALERMYVDHHAMVARVVRRVMGPDTEHDDLVQEVFYHAVRGVGGYRGDLGGVGAWLRAIAVGRCRKRIRRRRVRAWLVSRPPEELPDLPGRDDAHAAALLSRAWRIIEGMRTEERIAFTLRFVEGLTVPELVAATGASRSTVKRRLAAAREHFDARARADALLRERLDGGTP